jgi:hypothetical protein
MLMKLMDFAKAVSAVVAAFMALVGLAGWLNQAILDHLDVHFATKEDVLRVEHKVEDLTEFLKGLPHGPESDSRTVRPVSPRRPH